MNALLLLPALIVLILRLMHNFTNINTTGVDGMISSKGITDVGNKRQPAGM